MKAMDLARGLARGRSRSRRGSSLVFVVLCVSVVVGLSLTLASMIGSLHQQRMTSKEELSALYVCEAGLAEAVFDLAKGGTGDLGSEGAPTEFGSQHFWVEAEDLGGGRTGLTATGISGPAQTKIRLVVAEGTTSFFRWAAFGDEGLSMDSSALVDSYDSTLGPYTDQDVNGGVESPIHANENGDVGCNADMTLESNSVVFGDAAPGPSGTLNLFGSASVSGATTPLPSYVALEPIVVPSFPSLGALTLSGSSGLAPGNYQYTDFKLDPGAELTITGPAVVVATNFTLKSNSRITVDATNGAVTFYVLDDFVLNSNTQIASTTYAPSDIAFKLLSDNVINPEVEVDVDYLVLDSNSKLYGTIYAPSANIEVDSNFELFGSLIARSVHLDSNSKIHFDESLLGVNGGGEPTYETLFWRIVAD